MAKADKKPEVFDDDDDLVGDVTDPGDETIAKEVPGKKSDALRKIEEYRQLKALRDQVSYFDDDSDGDDYLSEI